MADRSFSDTLSALRREKDISQRKAAADLNVSQALLSHYENGVREPGLDFVRRACDYYKVSADYLLCRTENPDGAVSVVRAAMTFFDEIRCMADRAQTALQEFSEEGADK